MKYTLRKDLTKIVDRGRKIKLFQVEALRDFAGVKKGELGGFIASEKNLSQNGDCWLEKSSCIFENAQLEKNARLQGQSQLFGDAFVSDDAVVVDSALSGRTFVGGSAYVKDSLIRGWVGITDSACVIECHLDAFRASISGDAFVTDVTITCPISFGAGAKILNKSDFIYTYAGNNFTFYKSKNGWMVSHLGCYYTVEEFLARLEYEKFKSVFRNQLKGLIQNLNNEKL